MTSHQSSPARNMALIAVFAGFVAALGVIPIFQPPGFSVPITAQSLGVMLAGAILGARRGFASLVLFLALVAIGLPLLASRGGGLGPFFTPSVGFLLAWPFAAFVTGWVTERAGAPYRMRWGIVANIAGGIIVMYVGGIIGLATVGHLSLPAATIATWVYLPGDLAKAVVAALIARGVHAAYPGLVPQRAVRTPETSAA